MASRANRYVSKWKSLKLVYGGGQKVIEFVNGEFSTNRQQEINYIESHPDYGSGIWKIDDGGPGDDTE